MTKIDKNAARAEILACVGLCVNDFNYDKKSVLVLKGEGGLLSTALLAFLDSLKSSAVGEIRGEANPKSCGESRFDLIIDLSAQNPALLAKNLKENGIAIANLVSLEEDFEAAKSAILAACAAGFRVAMPFKALDSYFLFLSNAFHPLADLCLQKADALDGLDYYNAKIHEAIFALPNYLKTALKGVARN